jgi:hypothetical protein
MRDNRDVAFPVYATVARLRGRAGVTSHLAGGADVQEATSKNG